MGEYSVTASNPRETTTGMSYRGVPATDVDVRVEFVDGRVLVGEVTLMPRDGLPGLAAWGDCPDCWVSGALLSDIYAHGDVRALLHAIERATSEVAS